MDDSTAARTSAGLAHREGIPDLESSSAVEAGLRSSATPLDESTRTLMESSFGHDFGAVRVHTDETAAASAKALNARAFTVGDDVAFGPGEFAPSTQRGRELIAHELAHTIQQRPNATEPPSNDPRGVHETSADAAARDVASGREVAATLPAASVGLSLQPNETPDDERAKALAEAEEDASSTAIGASSQAEAGAPWMHDYGAAAMLAELDANKQRATEAEQEARREEEVARHDRLMVLRGLLDRRMGAGHPYRRNELVAMISSHPRDLLVLRHFGLELPGVWTKQKTYNKHVKAVLDAYDYDWRKKHGSGDAPSTKPWTESDQAAVDKRRKEDEDDAAYGQGYTYTTQTMLAGMSASATSLFTDDKKKIAAGAGLGMSTSGFTAPVAQAKGQQRTYAPQVQNMPYSPVGAWRYTGQPKIVESGKAVSNSSGNSGLTFPRPVDVTGRARFPVRDEPRVSMRLPEPKPVAKSGGRSEQQAKINRASEGPAGGKSPKNPARPTKQSDKLEEPDTHTLLSNREEGKGGKRPPRKLAPTRAPEVIDEELVGISGKRARYQPTPPPTTDPYANYIAARDSGIRSAGLGADRVPHFAEDVGPGSAHLVGRRNGWMSPDGSRGWRLDYSPNKGGHINWWRIQGGVEYRGSTAIWGADEAVFFKLLQGHFGMPPS